jgi:hypothetical protein
MFGEVTCVERGERGAEGEEGGQGKREGGRKGGGAEGAEGNMKGERKIIPAIFIVCRSRNVHIHEGSALKRL